MKVVTAAQMGALESRAVAHGLSLDQLMENAGLAVAQEVKRLLGDVKNEHITVLVGPGNNGGDGLVAARQLHDWGAQVAVILAAPRKAPDPKLDLVLERDIHPIGSDTEPEAVRSTLAASRVAIDAVFGTGRVRTIAGASRATLLALREVKAAHPALTIVAVDLPSGLDADTGACDEATPSADLTITLGAPKAGLFAFPGAAKVGRLLIVPVGIPPGLDDDVDVRLVTPDWVRTLLPARPLDANKGTFGRLLVVAGSESYIGAAYLACAAAIRAGAGLVTLAAPASISPVIAAQLPEVTHLRLRESEWGVVDGAGVALTILDALPNYDALLIGCGLGQDGLTAAMLRRLLKEPIAVPLLLDADALNLLSLQREWWKSLHATAILTPHPGELSRLLAQPVPAIQSSRLSSVRSASAQFGQTVLLKGAFSVVAPPFGEAALLPYANPALASAGTGDVLSGIIAGLLAQGLTPFNAGAAGAYLHGAAAENLRAVLGDSGLAASDLLPEIPRVSPPLRSS